MNLSLLERKYRSILIQSRMSPISRSATLLTFALVVIGLISSTATKFSFTSLPNILPLVGYVLVLDILSQLAPQTRIVEAARTLLFGALYLIITILCGVFAAYAMQRLAFPLEDQFLANVDMPTERLKDGGPGGNAGFEQDFLADIMGDDPFSRQLDANGRFLAPSCRYAEGVCRGARDCGGARATHWFRSRIASSVR